GLEGGSETGGSPKICQTHPFFPLRFGPATASSIFCTTSSPPSNPKDPIGTEQTTKGTFNSPVHTTGLVHGQVQPIVSQDPLPIESGSMSNGTRNGKTYESTTPKASARKPFSSIDDKYADGELLYRKLAELSGLNEVTIGQLISESNWKTWRKRRAGLSLMHQYMKLNNISPETILNDRPDVHVVNALAWINDKGGKSRKSNLVSLKTHTSAVLAQFSSMPRISDSPLIKNFSRCLNLNIESKARYAVIWEIKILLNHIQTTTFTTPEEIQSKAMTLLVCFSAARMTELSRIQLNDLTFSSTLNQNKKQNLLTITTQIKKGNTIRNEKIILKQTSNSLCPIKAINEWILVRNALKLKPSSFFWNFQKQTQPTSFYCSKTLTSVIRNAGILPPYNGPSIRHAVMTKLRQKGASIYEVNAFSRHVLTSTVVDAFYNRPIQRDLGNLLIDQDRVNYTR
ncbi:MAG: hypothetical protein EZS28_007820, partial [Streblomastix strix]